jgi:tRNA G46 methylase TrmB
MGKRLMKEHAKIACHNQGDVLEIGFGMGISATEIQKTKAQITHNRRTPFANIRNTT